MIHTAHLFSPLHDKLMELLRSLTPEEWQAPTIVKLWTVKDIAAHLLDGNLRTISTSRDNYSLTPDTEINTYSDLVSYLNRLNADWVKASKRLSPAVLIELMEFTGTKFNDVMASQDMHADAIYSVAWAGETVSKNWFHTAREFTEKWHHQQQIRDAVKKDGIMTREFFYPVINTFLQGLPFTFRNVQPKNSSVIRILIKGEVGGEWVLRYNRDKWELTTVSTEDINAFIELDPDSAWKLFTKGITPDQAKEKSVIGGDIQLAAQVFRLTAVMA